MWSRPEAGGGRRRGGVMETATWYWQGQVSKSPLLLAWFLSILPGTLAMDFSQSPSCYKDLPSFSVVLYFIQGNFGFPPAPHTEPSNVLSIGICSVCLKYAFLFSQIHYRRINFPLNIKYEKISKIAEICQSWRLAVLCYIDYWGTQGDPAGYVTLWGLWSPRVDRVYWYIAPASPNINLISLISSASAVRLHLPYMTWHV